MKWADLSDQAKNILEHSFDVVSGKPNVLDVEQGKVFYIELNTIPRTVVASQPVTRSLMREIKEYATNSEDSTMKMEVVTTKHVRIHAVMSETSAA